MLSNFPFTTRGGGQSLGYLFPPERSCCVSTLLTSLLHPQLLQRLLNARPHRDGTQAYHCPAEQSHLFSFCPLSRITSRKISGFERPSEGWLAAGWPAPPRRPIQMIASVFPTFGWTCTLQKSSESRSIKFIPYHHFRWQIQMVWLFSG